MRLSLATNTSYTMSETMDLFLSQKQAQKIAPRTLKDYQNELGHFLETTTNALDSKVLEKEVLKYFKNLPDTSPAVFNRPYQCLSAYFNWCVKNEYLPSNPLTKLGIKKKRDDGSIHSAPIEDVKKLMKACDMTTFTGFRNHTIIMLMMDTGIRTNELVQLIDTDFDPTAKTILIRKTVAKTRNTRIVFVSLQTATAISKLIRMKPSGFSEFIFPSREGNKMDTNNLSREFRNLCEIANVKITPYQLRHSFATYFVANGGNVFTLQNLMGHSDIRMTRRYTDINPQMLETEHRDKTPLNLLLPNQRLLKSRL